jgi:ribonuclease HI
LEKIIHSALKNNIKTEQAISCVFLENFTFLKDGDFSKFIRMNRQDDQLKITVSTSGFEDAYKLYTDGSFNSDTNQSGYGGVIVNPAGSQELFSGSFDGGSSNLMELLAVLDGLQRLAAQKCIQVYTDSRFVIRGLVQWVHFWNHNNWQTAFARDVRYVDYWQQAYRLCDGKSIEFKWIKAHSGHLEHDFCHQLARTCSSC